MSALPDAVPPPSPVTSPTRRDPAAMPLERIEAEICTLAGQIAAATSRFLRLLADFDARDGWAGWGVRSCAHWLSWRCGLDLHTAREYCRVARALDGLPRISEAFAGGRVSYSKVRAVSRVATPDNEDDLLHAALHNPAAQVERLVRGLRKAQDGADDDDTGESSEVHAHVRWRWDDDGRLVVWGRLSAEDGSRLLAGLTRIDQERRRGRAETSTRGQDVPAGTSDFGTAGVAPSDLGPALVAAAEQLCTEVEAPVHAPAADVVVHVAADALVETAHRRATTPSASGSARIDDGPALTDAVLQRLACDGRIQLSVDGPDGRTLDLGRRRRYPNRAQLDALWRRDRGCAAPGCDRTRFLHAHHVVAWARGGPTSLDNLLLLCGEHHRALHEGEFSVVALGRQRFRFHGPGGAERPPAPRLGGDAAHLVAAHSDVGPGTIEPDWDGAPLHLHEAVSVYLASWGRRRLTGAASRHTKTAVPGTNRPLTGPQPPQTRS